MTSRKKPGVAFWATVALTVLVLYFASYGPMAGLYNRRLLPPWLNDVTDVCSLLAV